LRRAGRTYSLSIGSHFATPCKSWNAWSIIQHAATIFFAYFVGFQHNDSISQDFSSKLSTRAALKIPKVEEMAALLRRDAQHSTQNGRK
jgi:hypothetical protein